MVQHVQLPENHAWMISTSTMAWPLDAARIRPLSYAQKMRYNMDLHIHGYYLYIYIYNSIYIYMLTILGAVQPENVNI